MSQATENTEVAEVKEVPNWEGPASWHNHTTSAVKEFLRYLQHWADFINPKLVPKDEVEALYLARGARDRRRAELEQWCRTGHHPEELPHLQAWLDSKASPCQLTQREWMLAEFIEEHHERPYDKDFVTICKALRDLEEFAYCRSMGWRAA